MLSARFFHCWRAIFALHSHLIFFAPWGIYTHFVTLPPVFTGQLHSIQWKPRTPWGKCLLALWFFLQFLTTTFLYFMRTQYAISLAFGNPTVLYCREALNASKKSYTGLKLCHSHRCTTLGHAMKLGEKLRGQVTSDWFCHLNSLGFKPITQINTRLLIFSWFPINVRFIFVILYCSG